MRFLIVEDNELDRALICAYVESLGWTAVVAEDMATALDFAANQRFDALLFDQNLPDGAGLQAIQSIRQESANLKTPALIWTAYETGPLELAAKSVYDLEVFGKPFSRHDLVSWADSRQGRVA